MACLASALVSVAGAAWQPSAAARRMERVWPGRIAHVRLGEGEENTGAAERWQAATGPSHLGESRSFAPTHPSLIPLGKVCTSDRGAGGRGGGRFTREGATKAELGGAELARAGTRPRGVFRSALACRRP